jgi:hypothetical protein
LYAVPLTSLAHQLYDGVIYLAYSNIKESAKAAKEIPAQFSEWTVEFITSKKFADECQPGLSRYTSFYHGQLAINARFTGDKKDFDSNEIFRSLVAMLKSHGEILALRPISCAYPYLCIRIEFVDVNVAESLKMLKEEKHFDVGKFQSYVYKC